MCARARAPVTTANTARSVSMDPSQANRAGPRQFPDATQTRHASAQTAGRCSKGHGEAAEHAADGAEPKDQTDVPGWDMLRMGLSAPAAYPHVARIGLDLVSGTGEQRSQWAIEALLTGIAGTGRN